jgi:hypothetical protein
VLLLIAAAAACAAPAPRPADSSPADTPQVRLPARTGPASNQEWDKSIVDQLYRDARRLANAEGCSSAGACRTAPIGVKACGGPQGYIVYCATATDSVALFRKLDELARAERAYNERYGIMSTCEFRIAPDVALVGQTCRAVR